MAETLRDHGGHVAGLCFRAVVPVSAKGLDNKFVIARHFPGALALLRAVARSGGTAAAHRRQGSRQVRGQGRSGVVARPGAKAAAH